MAAQAPGPRRLLLLAALPALAVALVLLLAPRHTPASPVLHIRLAARCSGGVSSSPSPCPTEAWIDEVHGAVRERQIVSRVTMDQIFVRQGAGWRVANRIQNDAWSTSSEDSLPSPFPRTLADLRAAVRRLERAATDARPTVVRGRATLAIAAPLGDLSLPWPLATADTVYVDRATTLPVRIANLRGSPADVFVDEETTAQLPTGFLALPGQPQGPLDALLALLDRLRARLGLS